MEHQAELKYHIHYYCKEKYFQTMQNLSLEGIRKYPHDLSYKLYSGFSLALNGCYQESIRELESLQSVKDFNIGALIALVYCHRSCKVIDKEAITQFDVTLKSERKTAGEIGLWFGALFLFFIGKYDKARDYVDKLLKSFPESNEGLTLKGWLEISDNKNSKWRSSATAYFEKVLEKDKKNMDACFGLIKIKQKDKDFEGGLVLINQLVVKFPDSVPPLLEKMKNLLALGDWEQTLEICNRILTIDNHCIEAFRMKIFIMLCKDGNCDETAVNLRRLFGEMEKFESKNAKLFVENGQLFSYVCFKNMKILNETYRFVEKAAQIEPSNAEFISELGNQSLLQNKLKEGSKFFKNATKIDDSSVNALIGLTLCQIEENGITEQVKQQVEFLREIQGDSLTPELLLMSAKLYFTAEDAVVFLNKAIELQKLKYSVYPYGIQYILNFNPFLMMQIVYEYLKYAPANPIPGYVPECLVKSSLVLEDITNACKGLLEPVYQYGRVQYLMGDINGAKATLQHILDDLDATSADTHLLMAQIYLKQKNYQQASQSLEIGISYNFKVREHPLYHLITAMVFKEEGNVKECIESLKLAMKISGIKPDSGKTKVKSDVNLSIVEKSTLYLELIEAYQSNEQVGEASKLMQEAMETFKGTSEEGRVFVANAELSVRRGQVNQALEQLKLISPRQTHYTIAKTTMADIYLNQKKDRESYAECYRDLVQHLETCDNLVLLGDAYMRIQEADKAIEAYETALKKSPKDSNLVCKLGKALVKTHHFSKAISYYKDAVKTDSNGELIYDMAELYFKLGQLDSAEKVLTSELESNKDEKSDISVMSTRTKQLQLLAKVRDKCGNLIESLSAMKEAKENHLRIEKRSSLSKSSEHRQILANICSGMAILMTRLRDFNGAIKSYKESLGHKPDDPKILVALSRLYLQVNDLDECQLTSQKLLTSEPDNEPATVMLADLAFRKVDFETAGYHFQQLLNRRPDNWTALARLVEVMRRTGRLEETVPYLNNAELSCTRPGQEAGLAYCRGLHEWYSGNLTTALHAFNKARNDMEWGQQAVFNMIEICLNPDNETLVSEGDSYDLDDLHDSRQMALRTAQRLLKELRPQAGSDDALNHRMLTNFWLLCTRQKVNVEKALQDFAVIANQESYSDHVGSALGMASAYILQKQLQKARNILKRVVKSQWNFEDAEYLERSWLLLADIYMQSGKMDLPADLIQRVLQHNKSCVKAYEFAGYIAEKEQLYKDAAYQYENAWRYSGQSNPTIGYKLAFNYLKAKRYADAIDVCNTVLKLYPDYPKIEKDILDKAKNNLRT